MSGSRTTTDRRGMLAIAGVLLAAGVAALWFWIRAGPPATPELADGPVGATATGAHALGAELGSGDARGRVDGAQAGGTLAPEGARGFADASPNAFEILVVRGAQLEPVEGADVHAYECPQFSWWSELQDTRLAIDPEGEIARRGVHARSDAQGIALCPEPKAWLLVCARKDDALALDVVAGGAVEPVVLTLVRQHDVAVRVLTADGRPAGGIRVGLGPAGTGYVHWTCVADDEGRATIRNLEALVAANELEEARTLAVRLEVPVEPPIERWIDPAAPPAEPIELRLRGCGTLEVRTLDCVGRTMALDGRVSLEPLGRPGAGGFLAEQDAIEVQAPLVAGRALVPCVEPGGRYALTVLPEGGGSFSEEVAGPESPGQGAVVEMRAPDTSVLVQARALDAQRQPLVQSVLEVLAMRETIEDGHLMVFTARPVTTDAEGRFRVHLRVPPSEQKRRAWRLRGGMTASRPGQSALRWEFPAEIRAGAGVLDLGDAVFDAGEVLLSGRAVDEHGAGVPDLALNLARIQPGRGPVLAPGLRTRTAADGRFEFHGTCTAHGVRALLTDPDREIRAEDAQRTFPCGTRDVLVHVATFGRVEATILVDPEHLARVPPVQLADVPGSSIPSPESWRVPGGWRLRFRAIPAGTFALRVLARDEQEVLHTVPDVAVRAGETTRDPRLTPLDLRGRLPRPEDEARPGEITVLDASGGRAERGLYWFFGDEHENDGAFLGGRIRLAAEESSGVVSAWAVGHRLASLRVPAEDPVLRLQPALRVRLRLALPADLREAGVGARVQPLLDPETDSTEHAALLALADRGRSVAFDARGEALVELPAAGAWLAGLELAWETAGAAGYAELHLALPVRDQDGEQTVALAPTSDEWQDARDQLGLPGDDR